MRLEGTVVLYDGRPYYILCIEDHKDDGIFRVYLDEILYENGHQRGVAMARLPGIPYANYPGSQRGEAMDKFLEQNKDCGIIRKMMNSPMFNKFRPFPLGMINHGGNVIYAERHPTRSTNQGLTQQMVHQAKLSGVPVEASLGSRLSRVEITHPNFGEMIIGNYPTPEECLKAMRDPAVGNTGVAFHRLFAILRGPLDMLFIAYKNDIVGFLPNHDLSVLSLGKKFAHLQEAITELDVFGSLSVKKDI